MIVGIGLDIVHLDAFRAQLVEPASRFREEVFTTGEQRAAETRPGGDIARHLGARFAAKEAFLKAWSSARRGLAPALGSSDLREVEVVSDPWGRPSIRIHGRVAEAMTELGPLCVHLSLSHDGPLAAATVVLEKEMT